MSKNIILAIIIIILVGVVGYFAIVRELIPSETPPASKMSEFKGYTEAEQQCNSYFGTFFGGNEIPSELAKKAVDVAKDFLKNEVGEEQFFKTHYRYKCAVRLRSIREPPDLILVPFGVKVTNKDLDFDTTATKMQPTEIQIGVDKNTLQVGAWDILLKKDALLSEKWLPRKDVLDALKPQISEELRQKINSLESDEISVEPFLFYYESDKSVGSSSELRLYWSVVLGKWYTDFCQLYSLSAMNGTIVYEQSCSK